MMFWMRKLFGTRDHNSLIRSSFRKKRRVQSVNYGYETLELRRVMAANLVPFDIESSVLYQIHGVDGNQGQLSEIDLVNDSFVDVGVNAGFKINATGFRVADGLIYGIKVDTDELIRIGAVGSHEVLGNVQDLPNGRYFTGDFGGDGLLYVRHDNQYFGIDVDQVRVERVVTASQNVKKTYDIAYNPTTQLHYSIRKVSGGAEFISIDLSEGPSAGQVTVINDNLKPAGTYGAVFADHEGRVFAANNAGGLYEIDLQSGVATFAGESPRATSNDGASSTSASIDLPPIATDSWLSVLPGSEPTPIPIIAPYDLENQPLTIQVERLPELGDVFLSTGDLVETGQALTLEQLGSLLFQAVENPNEWNDVFEYRVSDVHHSVTAQVSIGLTGRSKVIGQVVVHDDTEERVFDGYAYNNEISLTGRDVWGQEVSRIAISDIEGRFEFDELQPGQYEIQQIQPPVVFDGWVEKGNLPGVTSANRVEAIVIPNEPFLFDGLKFVETAPTALSGFVYVDANGNGDVDTDEEGIANVEMKLTGTDRLGNSIDHAVTTDSYGYYEFVGIHAGEFTVQQIQPEGFVSAGESVGDFDGVASTNQISEIELSPGQVARQYNFGEYEKSSIGGHVYVDNDFDNVFDQGDTPLVDVIIELIGNDVFGNSVVLQTASDTDGSFAFDELVAGTYDLVREQPHASREAFSHIGVFNNDETTLPSNGRSFFTRIADIEIGPGRHGRSFDFGERDDHHFVDEFEQDIVINGTPGNDEIEFLSGETEHQLIVNGVETLIDAGPSTRIRLLPGNGFDKVTMTGSLQVEKAYTSQAWSSLRSQNWQVVVTDVESLLINSGGGNDRAFMFDTNLDDRVKITQDYSRLWNDQTLFETRGFHRSYVYADNGGLDRAYIFDSPYDDTVKMTALNARIISRKFYSFARGFERVYAESVNGGADRVQVWDSNYDSDVLRATPERVKTYNGSHYYNVATGFERVDAFAVNGGDNDRAFLFGSSGDEILVANPSKAGLTGLDFRMTVHHFDRVYAYGQGGKDRAYLFDSKLDDRFIGRATDARLYNDHYYLKAESFAQVDAYSSRGGNDRAYFYDSSSDDVLIGLENEVRMYGETFDNTSHGFARAYGHATGGGNDQAFLYDTDRADTINIESGTAKIYGETYYSWINGFENVASSFVSASRHDRALVFGAVGEHTLEQTGELAHLIYENAAFFIYDIEAHEGSGGGEDDTDSHVTITEDLLEILVEKD